MQNPSIKIIYNVFSFHSKKNLFSIEKLLVIANVSGFLQLYGQEVPPFLFISFHLFS